jgi:hypothetical protein
MVLTLAAGDQFDAGHLGSEYYLVFIRSDRTAHGRRPAGPIGVSRLQLGHPSLPTTVAVKVDGAIVVPDNACNRHAASRTQRRADEHRGPQEGRPPRFLCRGARAAPVAIEIATLPSYFAKQVATVLKYYRAGYRLVDGRTFFPIASEENAKVADKGFAALNSSDVYSAASKHLTSAAERLTAGDWPGSIRESIHAVESVVRVLMGKEEFGKAIAVLEKRWSIHGALKASFGNLYGYTSDEPGIRHPLLDDPKAAVDEADGLFMFGACSAFLTYLIEKAKTAKD